MKILKTKKYANTFGDYDPYKVNFKQEREKASNMDTDSLLYALKDAIEASQVSVNEGKYYDQASVYRRELENRGISIAEQDRQVKAFYDEQDREDKGSFEAEKYTGFERRI